MFGPRRRSTPSPTRRVLGYVGHLELVRSPAVTPSHEVQRRDGRELRAVRYPAPGDARDPELAQGLELCDWVSSIHP